MAGTHLSWARIGLVTAVVVAVAAGALLLSGPRRSEAQGQVAVASTETVYFIPAAAQLAGAAGTNWRTDVEIVNPGTTQAAFTVALLKHETDNAAPETRSFTLEGGRAVRYSNVLSSVFGFTGKASLRLTVTSGSVLASARTYNVMVAGNPLNLPAGATFGQFVPSFLDTQAINPGEGAFLIQLTHTPNPFTNQKEGFRTNLGYVNTTATPVNLIVDLYRADGVRLGSFNDSLPAFGYKQVDKVFERVTTQAVADGYAVVRTTTTGGKFIAYASVVDNVVGDPIFVAHRRVTGYTPPAGTPTPTPTPTRTPTPGPTPAAGYVGFLEATNEVFTVLEKLGVAGRPRFEDVVRDLQTRGLDAKLDEAVSRWPGLATRLPKGLLINYGSGYTRRNGSVLRGTVTVDASGLNITPTRITGSLVLSSSNFSQNNVPVVLPTVTVGADLTTDAYQVYGSLSFSGSATTPEGPASLSGNVQVFSGICARYPLGGTLTLTHAGATRTITFNSRCDGTFTFSGGPLGYYRFELRPKMCDGSGYSPFGVNVAVAAEGSALVVDPTCPGTSSYGARNHRLSGTVSSTAVRMSFRSWYADHFYQGTFEGTSSNGVLYPGTALYTVTVYNTAGDPNSGVRCQSGIFTATGAEVTFLKLPVSYCQ